MTSTTEPQDPEQPAGVGASSLRALPGAVVFATVVAATDVGLLALGVMHLNMGLVYGSLLGGYLAGRAA